MLGKLTALKNKKGFTLVELIVVIAIIAVLVAIAAPAMVAYIEKAEFAKMESNCRAVVSAATASNAAALAGLTTSGSGFLTEVHTLLGGDVPGSFGGGKYIINGRAGINGTGATDKLTDAFKGGIIDEVIYTVSGKGGVIWKASDNKIVKN